MDRKKWIEIFCKNCSRKELQKTRKEKLQKDILELVDNYIKDSYCKEINNIQELIITETCDYKDISNSFPTIKNYLYQTGCNYFINMDKKEELKICQRCNKKIYYEK
jgi:hypothetical protein